MSHLAGELSYKSNMKKLNLDATKLLKKLSLVLYFTLGAFVLFLVIFGFMSIAACKTQLPDVKNGFVHVIKYPFANIAQLLSFERDDAVLNAFLRTFLFFFFLASLIYLVVGIIIYLKKKNKIVIIPIIFTSLVLLCYIFYAASLKGLTEILTNQANALPAVFSVFLIIVFVLISLSFLGYVLIVYFSFFKSIGVALKNPQEKQEEDSQPTNE